MTLHGFYQTLKGLTHVVKCWKLSSSAFVNWRGSWRPKWASAWDWRALAWPGSRLVVWIPCEEAATSAHLTRIHCLHREGDGAPGVFKASMTRKGVWARQKETAASPPPAMPWSRPWREAAARQGGGGGEWSLLGQAWMSLVLNVAWKFIYCSNISGNNNINSGSGEGNGGSSRTRISSHAHVILIKVDGEWFISSRNYTRHHTALNNNNNTSVREPQHTHQDTSPNNTSTREHLQDAAKTR